MPAAFVFLQHRNKEACKASWIRIHDCKLLHLGNGHLSIMNKGRSFKLLNQTSAWWILSIWAESALGDSRRADKHTQYTGNWLAAISSVQADLKQSRRKEHLPVIWMFRMPNQEVGVFKNVSLVGAGRPFRQCVQQCPILLTNRQNMHNMQNKLKYMPY